MNLPLFAPRALILLPYSVSDLEWLLTRREKKSYLCTISTHFIACQHQKVALFVTKWGNFDLQIN